MTNGTLTPFFLKPQTMIQKILLGRCIMIERLRAIIIKLTITITIIAGRCARDGSLRTGLLPLLAGRGNVQQVSEIDRLIVRDEKQVNFDDTLD